jgi:hypothetical protein
VQLAVNLIGIPFDGADGEDKLLGDFAVGKGDTSTAASTF